MSDSVEDPVARSHGSGGPTDRVAEAVEAGDLDELVRLVDGLCGAREWSEVIRLRDRCRLAVERGLQLWPAAEYAEYRLALEAPGPFAGPLIREGAGRFALGPLWEVAASTHRWADLDGHVPEGPARTMAAHERVVRGEDLEGAPGIDPAVLEVPLRLQAWEPRYPIAAYKADKAEFPNPPAPALEPVRLPAAGEPVDDPDGHEALYDLGRVWAEQSNGRCRVAVVEGPAAAAIAALVDEPPRAGAVDPADGLAWMAWAGASGGAYGRRRGTPAGRFAAWWAVAAIVGIEWPADPAALGREVSRLEWLAWSPAGASGGWGLHLAVADRAEGMAWAVAASDSHREGDEELGSRTPPRGAG
jgi:hypothetical protein